MEIFYYLGIAVVAGVTCPILVLWIGKLITPKTKEDIAFDNTMNELHKKHEQEQETVTKALDKMLEDAQNDKL